MNRLTRSAVLLSLIVACALEVHLAARELGLLLPATGMIFAIALAGAVRAPRPAMAAALFFSYITPVLMTIVIGRFRQPYVLLWIAAVAGVVCGSGGARRWALPERWRWPLSLWALVLATTWPLIVWREVDFDWALLWNDRLANTSAGVSPAVASVGILDGVITQLLGILWFDWLYREYRHASAGAFLRWVVVPLAASLVLGSLLAAYQGFFDLSLWSAGQWPALQRAAGPMLDANASGILAACWIPVFAALAAGSRRLSGAIVPALAAVLAFTGLWCSGSRTALLATLIGLTSVAGTILLRLPPAARRWAAAGAGLTAALAIVAFSTLPLPTLGPLARLRMGIDAHSHGGVRTLLTSLWDRDAYGSGSTVAIRETPWVGVGAGAFTLLSLDYAFIARGARVEYDNAQNWFRHQLAELGLIGSVGWIAWVVLFCGTLARSRVPLDARPLASATAGALLGFTAASMLGVPSQVPAVTLTFWLLAFWTLTLAVSPDAEARAWPPFLRRPAVAWGLVAAVVSLHCAGTIYVARHQFAVPHRAQRLGWPYQHGFYPAEPGGGRAFRWTGRSAVAVVPVTGRTLVLTFWTEDPEAVRQPVHAQVWVDGRRVVDVHLKTRTPLTRLIPIPPGTPRIVVRTSVDRTWRNADAGDPRELGLAFADWTFRD